VLSPNSTLRLIGLLFVFLFLGAWAGHNLQTSVLAQEPEGAAEENKEAADEPAAEEGQGQATGETMNSLGGLVVKSGAFGIAFYTVLGIFSIVALTVAIERAVNLNRGKVVPPVFANELTNLVSNKQDTIGKLKSLCDRFPSPAARVLHSGLMRAGRPLPEVEKAMEDTAAREMAALRGRNRPLSVVGNVAPLVGLLGTVVGMIFAFRNASQAGLGKAELLAEGIYLALMTTAAGLTIAIPCLLLVARFNAVVDKFMWNLDETLLESMPTFTRFEHEQEAGGIVGGALANAAGPDAEKAEDREPALAGS